MNERLLLLLGPFARHIELFFGRIARIGVPRVDQFHGGFDIELRALRLKVGAMWPADFGPFVPLDAEPFEAVEDGQQGFGAIAFGVRIVDAKGELALVGSGGEQVEQRSADAADMQVTGGTRGEAGAYGHEIVASL